MHKWEIAEHRLTQTRKNEATSLLGLTTNPVWMDSYGKKEGTHDGAITTIEATLISGHRSAHYPNGSRPH